MDEEICRVRGCKARGGSLLFELRWGEDDALGGPSRLRHNVSSYGYCPTHAARRFAVFWRKAMLPGGGGDLIMQALASPSAKRESRRCKYRCTRRRVRMRIVGKRKGMPSVAGKWVEGMCVVHAAKTLGGG